MDKKTNLKDILIVFLIIIVFYGLWQFFSINKELEQSQNILQHIQNKVNQEEVEKERYKLQVEDLRLNLESANTQLRAANEQLITVNQQLETSNQQLTVAKTQLEKLSILEADNAGLSLEKQGLEQKIRNLENDMQVIEAKLHSLPELRKFVRQAKNEIHEQTIRQYLARKQQQKEADAQETSIGNRGFIVKDSKSTYKATVRIEVMPEDNDTASIK